MIKLAGLPKARNEATRALANMLNHHRDIVYGGYTEEDLKV